MRDEGQVRIDKWLFAMRLFKTRSQAAEYCGRERVWVGEQAVKASRMVGNGAVITLLRTGFRQVYEVLQVTDKRLPARLVPDYCREITPREEMEKMELIRARRSFLRERGTGRPTKRERRELDEYTDW